MYILLFSFWSKQVPSILLEDPTSTTNQPTPPKNKSQPLCMLILPVTGLNAIITGVRCVTQPCAAVQAPACLMWWGQQGRQTVICHSAEIHSSQVEGDNIVSESFQLSHNHLKQPHTHKICRFFFIFPAHAKLTWGWTIVHVCVFFSGSHSFNAAFCLYAHVRSHVSPRNLSLWLFTASCSHSVYPACCIGNVFISFLQTCLVQQLEG